MRCLGIPNTKVRVRARVRVRVGAGAGLRVSPNPNPNPNPNPDPDPNPEQEFHGITLIEDAYTLWAKMKAERGVADWNPELDEEFEDRQGNVMNRKTYTDLARQGLLD